MRQFLQILKDYEDKGVLTGETLVEALEKEGRKRPEKIAAAEEKETINYGTLIEKISMCADGLHTRGIKKGDKVLLQMPNGISYLIMLFAVMKAGGVPVLLLQEHRENEIVSIGRNMEAKALISCQNDLVAEWKGSMLHSVGQISSLQLVITDVELITKKGAEEGNIEFLLFQDILSGNCLDKCLCSGRDNAVYLLSGGTTGVPKIIPKVQEAYLYNARAAAKRCRFCEDTVYLAVLSASHDLALANPGILGALFSGGTVVFSKTAAFDEAFELIEKYKVSVTCLVPALAKMWVEAVDYYENDLSSLKHILIGASKLDEVLGKQLIEKFHVKLQQGYGLGEGVTCFTSWEDAEEICLRTQGTPVSPFDEVKIVNENGCEVLDGEEGELIEKGPYTFEGYYHREELNQRVFTEDGFFCTGDKAKKDFYGNIIILGRVREQINRAGENVIPAEVESYLRQCPEIENACVFGMPDKKLGEKTVAVVIAKEAVDKKKIIFHFTQMGVASYKFPDKLVCVREFPYKNIGKVDKRKLKEDILLEGKDE